jgi:GNAT superfamily N-acetyltransferase
VSKAVDRAEARGDVRIGAASDLDGLTRTLSDAFRDDPLWSWAFPEREKLDAWWRFLVKSSLRYPWVWIAGDYAAASVWIPPGGTELTEGEEELVEPLLLDLLGARTTAVWELLGRVEDAHPRDRPHYYLSLLGTRPDHRGRGIGMSLLAQNLALIDQERMPAYLESSNPANDRRYQRIGFERVGAFSTPDGRHTASTMWREPR